MSQLKRLGDGMNAAENQQLLDESEIAEITGAKRSSDQAQVLDRHGIYYIRGRDGKIRTTWHHVNHPYSLQSRSEDGPNLEAI